MQELKYFRRFILEEITSDISLTDEDNIVVLADATSGNITVTLPTGDLYDGNGILVKKTDSSDYTVTVQGGGSDTIEGGNSVTFSNQHDGILLIKAETVWQKMSVTSKAGKPMLLLFGKNANSVKNEYLNGQHTIGSNITGYRMIRDGKVTGISWQIKAGTTSSGAGTIYIRKNLVDLVSISVEDATSGDQDDNLNGAFSAGDLISAYVDITSLTKPVVIIEFVWT